MGKSKNQQIKDALWYLEREGGTPDDKGKAVEILSDIVTDESTAHSKEWDSLKGRSLVIAVGHEPGGGADGEREWNIKVAEEMKTILESHGAKAHIYFHSVKSYTLRQSRLAEFCRGVDAFLCWELHYDSYYNPLAQGHHFKFLGAREWAVFTQKEWASKFPTSVARDSYGDGPGLHHAESGNGSGFLKKMGCWALLPEPFFNSNPSEAAFYKPRVKETALIYCLGAAKFVSVRG